VRRAIGDVDRRMGIVSLRTLDDELSLEVAQPAFRAAVLSAVAFLAAALAAIGLSGVVACSVSRRTAEIGVRIALGAARRDVLWMTLREGLLLGVAGGAGGLLAAVALTRLLAGFLFGVTATDPLSFLLAAGSLVAVVLAASHIPARRAACIDPVAALRAE
jgi:ABC-type antimicrobial peptide transport system permease subunit